MVTMPTHRQDSMEIEARFPISLADGIVLVQCLGLKRAGSMVDLVDPWCYPDDDMPATVAVKSYLQATVDKAMNAGKTFCEWTDERLTAYFLSPLLLPKGERPPLVHKPTRDAKEKKFVIPV